VIVQDTPTSAGAAAELRQARPDRPLWLIDAGGRLFDPAQGPAPLGEAAIRATVQALFAPHAAGTRLRSPQLPFARQLRARLAARSGQAVLSLDGVQLLQLDFATATARPLHSARLAEDVPGLLGPGFDRLVLRMEAPSAAPDEDAPRLPLIPLLWQTGLRMRTVPRLIEPLTESTALRMSQWPDFRVLAHRHDDFRLCSLLLKQACTADAAAESLKIDPGAARAFFNAAYLSGYATAEDDAAPAPPAAAPQSSRSPLARLWRGVRGGGRTPGDG
jgi:hypothetical protein